MPRVAVDLVPSVAVDAPQTMDQFDLAPDIGASLLANDPPVIDAVIKYLQDLTGTKPAVHLDFFAKHLEETIKPFNPLRRAYLCCPQPRPLQLVPRTKEICRPARILRAARR